MVVELAHMLRPESGRTPEEVAASQGLGGGWGSVLRPPLVVKVASKAPRPVLGAVESQPWAEQTSGGQGAEPPQHTERSLVHGLRRAWGPLARGVDVTWRGLGASQWVARTRLGGPGRTPWYPLAMKIRFSEVSD